jgi:hypothetical protein
LRLIALIHQHHHSHKDFPPWLHIKMKNVITIVLGCLALQAWTLPVETRSLGTTPIIEEAGEGYETKRAVAVSPIIAPIEKRSLGTTPIIEEAGEGYETKRAVSSIEKRSLGTTPIIEEAGEGYETKRSLGTTPIIEEAGEGYES